LKEAFNKMRQLPGDSYINLGLLGVGVFLMVLISDYPDMARRFPQLVLIALIILLGLDISTKIRETMWGKSSKKGDNGKNARGKPSHKRAFYLVGLMCVFQGCMIVFGFTFGSFIFLIFAAWALGYRKIKTLTFSSLIITGFIYTLFILIMDSYFPDSLIFQLWDR
jgi:protein-S-isoprenylcysteine O-methyltransferase Ste14